jgi:hypothetical protein
MDEHLNYVRLMAKAAGSKFSCEESHFVVTYTAPSISAFRLHISRENF